MSETQTFDGSEGVKLRSNTLFIILWECFESVITLNFLPILLLSPIFLIYLATVILEAFTPLSNNSEAILGLP